MWLDSCTPYRHDETIAKCPPTDTVADPNRHHEPPIHTHTHQSFSLVIVDMQVKHVHRNGWGRGQALFSRMCAHAGMDSGTPITIRWETAEERHAILIWGARKGESRQHAGALGRGHAQTCITSPDPILKMASTMMNTPLLLIYIQNIETQKRTRQQLRRMRIRRKTVSKN